MDRALAGSGRPLESALRQDMEHRFGHDFSRVRVHTGLAAEQSVREVNANAYTAGQDIVFGVGRFTPGSNQGQRLIAHELAHVVQQQGNEATMLPQRAQPLIMRKEADYGGTSRAEFLGEKWVDINELGLVYQETGANLREAPDGKVLTWLPQNTHVFILKHHPKRKWYAVSTTGKRGGGFGYIADWLVVRNLPDPEAEVLKIKSGFTPIDIARLFYAAKGFNIWGKDARYVVNALVWVNQRAKHNFPGESGLRKANVSDTWLTTKATADVYIWLPGATFLNAIYEQVAEKGGGTGSISADLWRGAKKLYEYVSYGIAFIGGLVHGFVKSLWDAVVGLAEMIVDLLVSIFTGKVLSDAKELWETVSKMTWQDIKDSVGDWAYKWDKKLNSNDPWTSGHAHGYLTGYIMAEAAQLLVTAGTLTAAKGALWGSRLGKAIQNTRSFKALVSGIENLGGSASKAGKLLGEAREALKATKAFTVLNVAREWAMRTLKLSADFVKNLSLEAINRLGRLPEAMWKRLARLSEDTKYLIFGCGSLCKCDTEAIRKILMGMTDEDIEKTLAPLGEAAKAAEQEIAAASRAKKTTKKGKAEKAAKTAALTAIPVEDIVQEAITILSKRGVKGLHPTKYGTKIAAAVNEILLKRIGYIPPGWTVGAEQRLGKIIKLSPESAKMTVREYMVKWNITDQYPQLSEKFLGTRIEDLKPDLFVRAPDGRALVWDVTSQPEMRHLSKTMLYSEIIGRELGGLIRISESYWRKVLDVN